MSHHENIEEMSKDLCVNLCMLQSSIMILLKFIFSPFFHFISAFSILFFTFCFQITFPFSFQIFEKIACFDSPIDF